LMAATRVWPRSGLRCRREVGITRERGTAHTPTAADVAR